MSRYAATAAGRDAARGPRKYENAQIRVVSQTQLSLELYFYARELNRADHVRLGLAPPGVGLLPPGEADIFATRGEAR